MNQPGAAPLRDPMRPTGRRQTPPRLRSPGPTAKTAKELRPCLRSPRCGPAVRWSVVLVKWSSRSPVAGRSSTSGTAASGMPQDVGPCRPAGTRCGFSATGKGRGCAAGWSFVPASRRRSGCGSGPANTAGVLGVFFQPMALNASAPKRISSIWMVELLGPEVSVGPLRCSWGALWRARRREQSEVRGPRKLPAAGTAAQSPWGSESESCRRAWALGPWGKRCR